MAHGLTKRGTMSRDIYVGTIHRKELIIAVNQPVLSAAWYKGWKGKGKKDRDGEKKRVRERGEERREYVLW